MSTMARDAGIAPGVMARRWDAARAGMRLETAGGAILRYGLAAILLYFRQDLWNTMTNQAAHADWIVVYAPASQQCPVPAGFQIAHTVRVQGAVLAHVYKR